VNTPLAIAGGLCALGAAWHGVGGEIGILRRLDPRTLAPSYFGDGDVTKRFLRACWHLLTVVFGVDAVALALIAVRGGGALLARTIAIQFACFLFVYVVIALPRPRIFLRAPQWAFFAAVATLAAIGA
jgi:hypothetical protein